MPWNEPGKDKDPWGNRNDDGPPDLDEMFKKFRDNLGGLFGSSGPRSVKPSSGQFNMLVYIILGIAAAVWLLSGIYIVDAGWRGVETRFGERTVMTQPGPHWHLPWPIENVEKINVSAIRTAKDNAVMLTEDENIISISLAVQYNVKNAQDYAFNLRDPDTTLTQATQSAIREVVGKNKMDYIITDGRSEVAIQTKDIIQSILDKYVSGLFVLSVNMDEAQPPEAVQNAFADAIKAREDQQRFINEAEAYRNDVVPKARGDAQRLIEEAEAYKTRVVKSAQGEADRFSQLLTEYQKAPDVTRERLYIETIESVLSSTPKVMVDVDSGSNLMMLPLDKLFGQSGSSSRSSGGSYNSPTGSSTNIGQSLDQLRRDVSRNRSRESR